METKDKLTGKQTFIGILIDYYEQKESILPYKKGSKTEIRFDTIWNNLKRVFNDGQGLLSFAEIDNEVLLINKLLCSKKELKEIEGLTIPFKLVELGYPDYYSKGLKEIAAK